MDREAGNPSVVDAAPAARSTVILLGASNVARSISTIVATAQQCCTGPIDLYAAFGHGRSYGRPSSIFGRQLPGIVECQLWRALRPSRQENFALITDIGNDLMYQQPVDTIAAWVETCLERLSQREARTVMTQLPLANLQHLSPARFKFFRNLFFPGCPYSLAEIAARAEQLDRRIVQLGRSYGVSLIAPPSDWYGWDPIHVSIRKWRTAWPSVLSPWNATQRSLEPARGSLRRWLYLRSRFSADVHWFGRHIGKPQPCGRLADGGAIAFF